MENEVKTHQIKLLNLASGEISLHPLMVTEGRHPQNHQVSWKLEFEFFGEKISISAQYYLSHALDEIRQQIEPLSYRMLIKWSEIDAVQSGMSADMSAGTKCYKYEILRQISDQTDDHKERRRRRREAIFWVLEEADLEEIASLEEQEKYRKEVYLKLLASLIRL